MNRTIKFRGKRVDTGEWVYGNLINKIKPIEVEPVFWASLIHDGALTAIEVIPETVGQFTGLTDKNGREIYEGDVLMCDKGRIAKVIFLEYMWCIESKPYSKIERKMCDANSYIINSASRYGNLKNTEIIGNIHDNPELINQ